MHTMNQSAIDSVYLFMAELLGYKRGTLTEKKAFGEQAYKERLLPEDTLENLHEIIWLERLYDEMSKLKLHYAITSTYEGFHWSVPIELDASASMLGYMGCLLGDKRLLEMTNMAGDSEVLEDPWYIEGLSRAKVKAAATPMLYGSAKTPIELWKAKELDYSSDDLAIINQALRNGALGMANTLKDFVIRNCNPKATMEVHIWNDKFEIECNHYKRIGDAHVAYDLYDTVTGHIRRIVHTKTRAVPDLERYRSYFQTLLIHNLDSQVANTVAGKVYDKYGFCLDVHDAFIVSPVAAADVRQWYAEEMDKIFANRKVILANYFNSIGITSASLPAWEKVMAKVVPVSDDFKCRGEVLK